MEKVKAQRTFMEYGGVGIAYLLQALVFTYPLVINFTTVLGGTAGDAWHGVWSLWWMKKALCVLHQNPFYTKYLFYPDGASLIFTEVSPFNGVFSIPLQSFLNLTTTYNVVLVFSFVMTGVGVYALCRFLAITRAAAFVGGVVCAFSPYMRAHGLGHMCLVSMEWIPFYLLYFIKAHQSKQLKDVLLAALFFFLVTMSSWYYLVYAWLISVVFTIVTGIKKRTFFVTLGRSMLIYMVSGVLLLPFFMMMMREWGAYVSPHKASYWSADLLSFFLPNASQNIGKVIQLPFYKLVETAEFGNYIGWTALAFIIFAIIKKRKDTNVNFFAVTFVSAMVLSMGPYLHIAGINTQIPMPYLFFKKIFPVIGFSNIPTRMNAITFFCAGVLVAYGIGEFLKRMPSSRKRAVVITAVFMFICIEYISVPFPRSISPVSAVNNFSYLNEKTYERVPSFFYDRAQEEDDYGIFHFLLNNTKDPRYALQCQHFGFRPVMFYQTIHGKPILYGLTSREKKDSFIYPIPGIYNILMNTADVRGQILPFQDIIKKAPETFKKHRIKYVILQKNKFISDERHLKHIIHQFGFPVVYEDKDIKVFQAYGNKNEKK